MSFSMSRVRTITRHEYLATVRRKAFVFTIVGTPLLYALLMFIVTKPQLSERLDALRDFRTLGVVDSSEAFTDAPRETETDLVLANPFSAAQAPPQRQVFHTRVRFYPDFAAADRALRAGQIRQVLVIPGDYLQSGRLRRYASRNNLFTSTDERVVSRWIVRGLLAGRVDTERVERAARPLAQSSLYALNREGRFELKDDRRETLEFVFPLVFGLLLGLCIVIGGQYMLQGINEEKESRILESMLSTVSPEELLVGKLLGLGGAGLTVAAAWVLMGSVVAGPTAAFLQSTLRPAVILTMIAYFLLGYLFYSSLMTGIGAVASNMREAQQFSVWFTFVLFIPFYMLPTLLGHPDSPLAVGLSLFPMTAPVSTILRMSAPGSSVPAWQVLASLGLLLVSGVLVMMASARVFRVGMLMYGKTPNLPEIVRWIRQR